MAPMLSAATVPDRQKTREASWQFVESEIRSERELSEEPASSYDEEGDMRLGLNRERYQVRDKHTAQAFESREEREDILHPLREAANRVGREVERFAELLDGYNPLRATGADERYDMTIDLIKLYHGVAKDTVRRLREQHSVERKHRADKKARSTNFGRYDTLESDMDVEEDDDQHRYGETKTTLDDLNRWEQEAQTWDLLNRIVQLRFPPKSRSISTPCAARSNATHQFSSEQEIWDQFLQTDTLALERNTVLQWLKATANEAGEDVNILVQDLQQNAERGDIIAHGWLHTKAAIKNQKRIQVWPQSMDSTSLDGQTPHLNSTRTQPLVTQLDPDAPRRQGRKLEVQDEYFERAIWLGCYEMLRRGKPLSEIKEWCTERTEVWRAVSMSGLPDDLSEGSDHTQEAGSSALWRRMCFALARKAGGDEYQRAVYGLLSGDISSVEPVCKTWDDFVFAHYNALLRTQFDEYLRIIHPRQTVSNPHFEVFDAAQFHGDPQTTGKRLVDKLRNDSRAKEATLQPMKMLQGVLIANEFKQFIYQQGLALSKFANSEGISCLIPPSDDQLEDGGMVGYVKLDDHDSLRVFTHVLLVFMALGMDLGGYVRETEVQNVIVAYISFLRLAGKEELIPLYSSQLSGTRRYAVLSRNLIDVTDREERLTQIKLMRELGLDVQEFVRMQARYLLEDYEDNTIDYPASTNFTLFEDVQTENGVAHRVRSDFLGEDTEVIERIDMLLIRSLEWYLLVDGLWSETFRVGTILYLRFYKHVHLPAAKMLATRVNSSEIAKGKTRAIIGESVDFTAIETVHDEDLTEVLDGTTGQKRQIENLLLAEAKNFRELEILTEFLDSIETITGMAVIMAEEHPAAEQKALRQQLAGSFLFTTAASQCLLKGWLLTSQSEEMAHEFKLLREAYIPETLLAYISVLEFGGTTLTRNFLLECMDLSAIIADEDSDLLDVFTKMGRMEELVEALASASKSLMMLTASKQGSESRSKKRRVKGWKQDIWNVRP